VFSHLSNGIYCTHCIYNENLIHEAYFHWRHRSAREAKAFNKLGNLNELLESTVDRRADVWDIFPEVNGSNSTLGNSLRSELELLQSLSA
jgi:hypothetical protein